MVLDTPGIMLSVFEDWSFRLFRLSVSFHAFAAIIAALNLWLKCRFANSEDANGRNAGYIQADDRTQSRLIGGDSNNDNEQTSFAGFENE